MNSQTEAATIRIVVKDLHKRRNRDLDETVTWHTSDRMEGYVVIQSPSVLWLHKIIVHLEGMVLLPLESACDGPLTAL